MRAEPGGSESIAVVGAGCRFPGGIRSLDELGALLDAGGDAVGAVPAERWPADVHDPTGQRPGSTYCAVGAFLDDIDRFDAAFFGISPREARGLDPQQRLLLEVAWEAMTDAGRPREAWAGSRTAVYLGLLSPDYTVLHAKTLGTAGVDTYYGTGKEFSFAAGRIAYTFDLRGPAMGVNTACSSSLVAVHMAVRALRHGECDSALVGGVNVLLAPELTVFMSRIGAMSRSGRCRPFDAEADGVTRGEGCGIVVLKRLSDALADRDRILAVIEGSAVNQDGRSAGITAPSHAAQRALLEAASADAALPPGEIDFVEAHGTGTPLGDPIELSALAGTYGAARPVDHPLVVGSHKANFGHMDAAAGICGLLKAIHVLRTEVAPRQPHLRTPVEAVGWDASVLHLPTEPVTLTAPDRPLRAGVSAFGLSGTNAHVILAQAPAPVPPAAPDRPLPGPPVLTVSATSVEGLRDQAARYAADVAPASPGALRHMAQVTTVRRSAHRHRLAVVTADPATAAEALRAYADGGPSTVVTGEADPDGAPRVAFVYSGQGTPWAGMALELARLSDPVRTRLEELDQLIAANAGWSLMSELARPADSTRLTETRVAQPAILAVQVALTDLWQSAGLRPAAVLGHSVGEIAAAWASGALSLAEAVRLAVVRGEILQTTAGTGSMTAVSLPAAEVTGILAGSGLPVTIAAVNGPSSVVIAGPVEAMTEAHALLARSGAHCVPLQVDHAFHSPVVAGCAPQLRAAVADLVWTEPTVPFVSTVDPELETVRLDPAYWERNLREPVQFWPAAERLAARDRYAFVEIGPRPVLGAPLSQGLRSRGRPSPVVAALSRSEPDGGLLAAGLATLHVCGVPVDWAAVHGATPDNRSLPPVSWAATRYWLPGVPLGRQSGALAGAVRAELRLVDESGRVLAETSTGVPGGGTPQPETPPPPLTPSAEPVPAVEEDAPDQASMVAAVHAAACAVLEVDTAPGLPLRQGLFELGLDSISAVELGRALATSTGLALPSTVVFEHPTITELADHLAAAGAAPILPEVEETVPDEPAAPGGTEPIAIIGMACRLPGAAGLDEYRNLLLDGRLAVGDLPAQRRAESPWREIGADVPTRGGYLDQDVTTFDAAFFRISPHEARQIDPQQRLLLETSWEALEDARLPADRLRTRPVGVYVGLNTADYQQLLTRDMADVDLYYGTGTSFAASAGRISYLLGLRGPSMAIDTACSSSLTAVHLACQSLRAGESEIALAGGANVVLAPTVNAAMAAGGALSADGRCKTFADSADGYGRGEGAGVVVLKRLAAALADGDRVHAVISGSAVNADGASGGLTVPSAAAQAEVMRAALARAGWEPAAVDLVEAHGTGTPLGDPIEIGAIGEVYGAGRPADQPVLVGSVKAAIGHLEAAAGVAALIKVVLAMRAGVVPPHRLDGEPSSRIRWESLPVRLAEQASWPVRDRRRAAVSAFGFTGSNAHVLVEEAPESPAAATSPAVRLPVVVPLSAAHPESLADLAARTAALAARTAADRPGDPGALVSLAVTAALHRTHLEHRLAVVADSLTALAEALTAAARGEAHPAVLTGRVRSEQPGPGASRGGDAAEAAQRFIEGRAVDWAGLFPGRPERIDLPTYPWRRRRHWYRPAATEPVPVPVPEPSVEPEPPVEPARESPALPEPSGADLGEVLDRVVAAAAEALGMAPDDVDPDTGFFELGMDSRMALAMCSRLAEETGLDMPATVTFEQPDCTRLARHLAAELAGAAETPAPVTERPGPEPEPGPSPEPVDPGDDLLAALERSIASAEQALTRRN